MSYGEMEAKGLIVAGISNGRLRELASAESKYLVYILPDCETCKNKEDNRTCAVCVGKTIDYQSSFYECALSGANELADRCSTCENNGKPICSGCIMTGHGNDIDFYRAAADAGKGE